MKSFPSLFCLALALTGCASIGGASPTSTPIPIAYATFHDPRFGFSFKYPPNWTIPKSGGQTVQISGLQRYVLNIALPGNEAGMSVEVNGDSQPLPLSFTNGFKTHLPNDPRTYVYFHSAVAGQPAMKIERYSNSQIDQIDTVFDTQQDRYVIRTISPNPPFTTRALAGYKEIVRTFKAQ